MRHLTHSQQLCVPHLPVLKGCCPPAGRLWDAAQEETIATCHAAIVYVGEQFSEYAKPLTNRHMRVLLRLVSQYSVEALTPLQELTVSAPRAIGSCSTCHGLSGV